MTKLNVTLVSALKTAGYSTTAPRQLVFDLLLEQEPQSMHQLVERAEGRIDRASVYRTVKLFEQLGIVQRIYIGWKYKLELTDRFSHHHHHLSCLNCGRVIPIEDDPSVDTFIARAAQQYGFIAEQHQFEISGYCQNCAQGISSRLIQIN